MQQTTGTTMAMIVDTTMFLAHSLVLRYTIMARNTKMRRQHTWPGLHHMDWACWGIHNSQRLVTTKLLLDTVWSRYQGSLQGSLLTIAFKSTDPYIHTYTRTHTHTYTHTHTHTHAHAHTDLHNGSHKGISNTVQVTKCYVKQVDICISPPKKPGACVLK